MSAIGWDHAETARYYETFCRRYCRYRHANRELMRHAHLQPGMNCLDLAAGTGRTAEAALPLLGSQGRVLCVEPAAAMRAAGRARLGNNSLIAWIDQWSDLGTGPLFDRIFCGAAIWQLESLADDLARIARLLVPGGALVCTIPSLYLGVPDEPGGGADPLLLSLPARIAARRLALSPPATAKGFHGTTADIDAWLYAAGLNPRSWQFRIRLSQRCLRDWLKIPVLSNSLLPGLTAKKRAAVIDAAFAETDAASWKWEGWTGWTAWKKLDKPQK